jgi:uncharacterized membrane protein
VTTRPTTPDPAPARPGRRGPMLSTSAGTNLEAFGSLEWVLLASIALIWGTSFLFMAIGLEAFEPGVITLARVGLGAAALALVPRARRTRIAREDLPQVAVLGLVWLGIPLLLFPVAQQWIDSSVAGMINAAMPLTTAVWSVVLLRRLPARTQAIGLVVGFLGIVAVSLPELPLGATATGTAAPRSAPGWCSSRSCSTASPRTSPSRCSSATARCPSCSGRSSRRWSS